MWCGEDRWKVLVVCLCVRPVFLYLHSSVALGSDVILAQGPHHYGGSPHGCLALSLCSHCHGAHRCTERYVLRIVMCSCMCVCMWCGGVCVCCTCVCVCVCMCVVCVYACVCVCIHATSTYSLLCSLSLPLSPLSGTGSVVGVNLFKLLCVGHSPERTALQDKVNITL